MGDSDRIDWIDVWTLGDEPVSTPGGSWITGVLSCGGVDRVCRMLLVVAGASGEGGVNVGEEGVFVEPAISGTSGLSLKGVIVAAVSGNSEKAFVALVDSGDGVALGLGDVGVAPILVRPLGHLAAGVAEAPMEGSVMPLDETMLIGRCLYLGDSAPVGDGDELGSVEDTVPVLGGDVEPSVAVESA